MKRVWFKIWATGNGGYEYDHKYVFWPDYNHDSCEMSYMIEDELGPFPSSVRSVHWEKVNPSNDVLLGRIRQLERTINSAIAEIYIHQNAIIEENRA